MPTAAAAVRNTFRLTGGALSIAAIVLTLSFFPDQGQGFSVVFLVSTAILVAITPLVFAIPDGKAPRRVKEISQSGDKPRTAAAASVGGDDG